MKRKQTYMKRAEQRATNICNEIRGQKIVGPILADIRQAEYAKQKQTPEYLLDEKDRLIRQNHSNDLHILCENLVTNLLVMRDEILQIMEAELEISLNTAGRKNYQKPSSKKLKEIVDKCMPALKKLKSASEHKFVYGKLQQNRIYSPYEQLFNSLIDIDPRFIIYAPTKSVLRNSKSNNKKISNMSLEEQKQILKYRELVLNNPEQDYVFTFNGAINEDDEVTQHCLTLAKKQKRLELEVCNNTVHSINNFADNIYNLIANTLNLNEENPNNSIEDITKLVKICSTSLDMIRNYRRYKVLSTLGKWDNEYNPYNSIISRLMEKDFRFVLFAPSVVANKFDYNLNKLTDAERDIILPLLIDKGWVDSHSDNCSYNPEQ